MRTSIAASANPLAICCASSGVEASAVTVTMFDWATGSAVTFESSSSGLRGESMSCLTRWATSMLVIRRLAVSTSRVGSDEALISGRLTRFSCAGGAGKMITSVWAS